MRVAKGRCSQSAPNLQGNERKWKIAYPVFQKEMKEPRGVGDKLRRSLAVCFRKSFEKGAFQYRYVWYVWNFWPLIRIKIDPR
jgi:hypothetical protein